jgi:hypothetical protein
MTGFGRSIQEGQKLPGAIRPAIRPAKRQAMQRPHSHAVLLRAAVPEARGPGRSVPLAWRPSRGAPRRLPLPTSPPPTAAMCVTHILPRGAKPRKFPEIHKKWPHGIYEIRHMAGGKVPLAS